jgi:UDP-galactopyranose mutase
LRFDIKHHSDDFFQEAGAVNFPNSHSYTRILEFKRLTGQTVGGTTVATEYPEDYCPGRNEPYYPVPMDENRLLYGRYADKAKKLNGRVLFAGRLGDYKYYNMDQAAARALQVFERDIASL